MAFVIAVTGAGGMLGSAVCELALEDGHTVIGIDRAECSITHRNFTAKVVDTSIYAQFLDAVKGCDSLVHLAAMVRSEITPQDIIHNINVVSSYNALKIAAELGIKRVVQASSVNVIGLAFSRKPKLDYLPLDENHPCYPEDAYSLSKCICEQQATSIARRYSHIRIASLRFHWIIPSRVHGTAQLNDAGPSSALFAEHSRDLWGWVSQHASARACLLGLTAKEGAWEGHEAFFIVAPNTVVDQESEVLYREVYPEVKDVRMKWKGNVSFFDCSKAERILGWKENEV